MTKKDCNHDWIPVRTIKDYRYEMEIVDWVVETVQQLYCPNCNTYKELESLD